MLDVISVLLFSLLANYIFSLKVDFSLPIDYVIVSRLTMIFVASFLFYISIDKLKKIERDAQEEFHSETNLEKKASSSIDDRYESMLRGESIRISLMILISIVLLIAFFFVDPFVDIIKATSNNTF